MEFEGRITRVLPSRSGTSQRGDWKTLPFVFEYFESQGDRYADRVLLETFDTNHMGLIAQYVKKGPDGKAIEQNGEMVMLAPIPVRIGFGHTVRSGQRQDGTTFNVNDLRLYKFEIITGQQQQQAPAGQAAQGYQQQQQYAPQQAPGYQPQQPPFPPQQPANNGDDDLPF